MYILFIGNSHTYYNELQDMFAEMVKVGKIDQIYSARCTGPGVPLSWHCDNSKTHGMICEHDWDYVVLQDRSGSPLETPGEMFESATVLHNTIKSKTGAEVVLYMTWANRLRPQDQKVVTAKYNELKSELNCMVAPVGLAWQKALESIDGLRLHDADNRHANPTGTYLASCVFYAAITCKSPIGLPGKIVSNGITLADVPADLAEQLQQISAALVL